MTQAAAQSFLLIGESNLARHVTALLARDGHTTTVLASPDDATLQTYCAVASLERRPP